jgi:cytochrome c biogenesis protein
MGGSAGSGARYAGLLHKAWTAVCSIRLSVALLCAVLLFILLGTLFPQASPEIQADELAYSDWTSAVEERYGLLGEAYRQLGLFNAYASPLLGLLLSLLLLNGVACTLNTIRPIWRTITAKPTPGRPDAFFERASNRATLSGAPVAEARKETASLLSRHRYHLLAEERDGVVYVSGRKNRFARLGTLISHGALVLVALGALWSSRSAWREAGVILGPGETYDVGHGHDFQVRHEGFRIEMYPDGQPKDYLSHLVVLERGAETMDKTIRVNDPLTYRGVSFYLSSWGPALRVRGWDSTGRPLIMETSPAGETSSGEAVLTFASEGDERAVYLPTLEVSLQIALHSVGTGEEYDGAPIAFLEAWQKGQDRPLFSDYVAEAQTVQLNSASLQFTSDRYSVLQLVSDPGFVPVVGASLVGMVGLFISFYFPVSRVWVKLTDDELWLAGSAPTQPETFKVEFQKLVTELEERLR